MENACDAVCRDVDVLLESAIDQLELDPLDVDYARNQLMELLDIRQFSSSRALDRTGEMDVSSALVALVGDALEAGLVPEDDVASFADRVLNVLSPSPALVTAYFEQIEREDSSIDAMNWLYDLCAANGSVHRKQLETNPHFESHGLVVTINTAKPEFKNMKKAAAGNAGAGGYPQCVICHENEGFAGAGGAGKRTLRTIPVELGGKDWFWQFSPYGYFYQHGICVNAQHTPMKVDKETMGNLLDFVDRFPGYFIGCNAALARIGGSILAHDHYQGGGQLLPMHTARVLRAYRVDGYEDVTLEVLDWPGSAVRVVSRLRSEVLEVSELLRAAWAVYENDAFHIHPYDESGARQSSLSPSVIVTDRGYEMSLIFRNNAVSDEYPDGIFHAHPQYYPVKQEPIGLIEAQGLFILPGRLVGQLAVLEEALVRGDDTVSQEIAEFAPQWEELVETLEERDRDTVRAAIREELGSVCYRILENTSVFPTKEDLENFVRSVEGIEVEKL
ncbi:galactose-1-phosphate uridylyltransferase [Alloscardovia macacae]|uniref:Galactose-1-phosphate uridylyltransferase n=1 Tax=Alloscardovia macacae TaxID=1160091 RepID=A0A1Y2SZL3_9BIFI|nr:galactose-1-phosphate uridylyltransferase [Alloscardovia macacae]OTA28471.1 galactose-1-phosphate uridylyltransferase [Alloscardovia macacae]